MLPRGAREGPQPVLAAEFVPHARVVDDVVAVRGAGDGLEDGDRCRCETPSDARYGTAAAAAVNGNSGCS